MQDEFNNHINSRLSFLKKGKILIAISGGIDSVVLTHLCHNLGLHLALAHCNFNLRGKESDDDEDFVLQLAEDLNLEVFIESFDTNSYAKENKLSIQMAARELRYDWFDDLANQLQYDYILTAHHADDKLETFFINLLRGTGLDGLKGIPEVNDNIVRPLLGFSREDIFEYAKINNLSWREDSSNTSTKYIRNKLRHDVIPVLKEMNPKFLQNFGKTQGFLKDSKEIITDSIQNLISKGVVKFTETGMKIDISILKSFNNPKAYLYCILNGYGFSEWDDVVKLLDAQSGKQLQTEAWRLVKDRGYLLLEPLQNETQNDFLIFDDVQEVSGTFGVLKFEIVGGISNPPLTEIYVDKNKLQFPLKLCKWEEGDYFYPLGMTGKKKLSKYFKDEKLSLIDKDKVWLLCSNDDVVWVLNRRADNRFRVTDKTSNILKIELTQ